MLTSPSHAWLTIRVRALQRMSKLATLNILKLVGQSQFQGADVCQAIDDIRADGVANFVKRSLSVKGDADYKIGLYTVEFFFPNTSSMTTSIDWSFRRYHFNDVKQAKCALKAVMFASSLETTLPVLRVFVGINDDQFHESGAQYEDEYESSDSDDDSHN